MDGRSFISCTQLRQRKQLRNCVSSLHTSSQNHITLQAMAWQRAVQTLKRGIARISGTTLQERVSKFLFNYRLTPHSVTGVAPSELLFGRRIRCRLDLWFPDTSQRVESQQWKQKQAHDSAAPLRSFCVGHNTTP